jgi:hypothetical protein
VPKEESDLVGDLAYASRKLRRQGADAADALAGMQVCLARPPGSSGSSDADARADDAAGPFIFEVGLVQPSWNTSWLWPQLKRRSKFQQRRFFLCFSAP